MATAALGIGGSLLGGLFGGLFASSAASKQLAAEQQAVSQLQQSGTQARGDILNQQQSAESALSPYASLGTTSTGNLQALTGTPGQGLLTPWTQTFTAPTAEQAEQTPGYQFQLQQGENAIQNSAAARGGLLSGQTLADMNNYAQGQASTNYQNTFNNALAGYNTAYNAFENNQSNAFNRLYSLSGLGANTAGQLANVDMSTGSTLAGLTTGIGADVAGLLGQQGTTQAGGMLGIGNSINTGISGALNNYYNSSMLSNLSSLAGNNTMPNLGGGPGIYSLYDPSNPLNYGQQPS